MEFLLTNKEWLFSGAGVTVCAFIIGSLIKLLKKSPASQQNFITRPTTVNVEILQTQQLELIPQKSEVSEIIKRFNKILFLMNEKRQHDKYTIAKLAQLMKLNSISELEGIFLGKKEPSFDFIEHFCTTFGVNKSWLIEGKKSPYYSEDPIYSDPLDYLNKIEIENPKQIYFIRSNSKIGEVFLLFKFSDFHYKILKRAWHISNHVGAGGQRQIFSMYKLIMTLKQDSYLKCYGRIVEENIFDKLINGDVFPASIIEFPNKENHWWDDFTDINHFYPIASNYEKWYGKGFIEAQSIVKQKLQEK